ncbi:MULTISPECIES: hypothetical protein [unclassified Brucella]|uniref:hypothetical protein n=1 Tax=unclassified Brucella TaxID=2632610 RepID=UPI000D03C041|nr:MULTISPECIES: hypothetical protein [unclassified Brucella]
MIFICILPIVFAMRLYRNAAMHFTHDCVEDKSNLKTMTYYEVLANANIRISINLAQIPGTHPQKAAFKTGN